MLKYQFDYDLDDARKTLTHCDIILNKIFLKWIYEKWYNEFITAAKTLQQRILLEMRSGGGLVKQLLPQVITSCSRALPVKCRGVQESNRTVMDNEYI